MKQKFNIVLVSGGFDPVHIGHVRMFNEAKRLGHIVIVGVNSDKWLNNKKGAAFMPFEERKEIIESFYSTDMIWEVKDDEIGSACNLLREARERFGTASIAFANGGDRVNGNTPEDEVAKELDITMLYNVGGGKVQSSSWLIEKANENGI